MNIVVVGAGGVGGYFGGRLAEAGNSVTFFVRGKTLEAIKENGLTVESIEGDFSVTPRATDQINEIASADLIILGVKSWQLEDVMKQLKPIVGKDTTVLPLQNGANNLEKLLAVLPAKNVIAGFCKVVAKITEPARIAHMAAEPAIVFGEIDNSLSPRIKAIKEVFETVTFKSTIPSDIHLEIWKKFLFIVTISGLGALTRMPLGYLRADAPLRSLMQNTAEEIILIANALTVPLNQDHKNAVFKIIDQMPYETTASVQRDLMEGRPSELQDFNGYIVNQGKKLQVDTPVNSFIYHCLLPMERQARNQL